MTIYNCVLHKFANLKEMPASFTWWKDTCLKDYIMKRYLSKKMKKKKKDTCLKDCIMKDTYLKIWRYENMIIRHEKIKILRYENILIRYQKILINKDAWVIYVALVCAFASRHCAVVFCERLFFFLRRKLLFTLLLT